jgi:hypothetical protein
MPTVAAPLAALTTLVIDRGIPTVEAGKVAVTAPKSSPAKGSNAVPCAPVK